MTNTAIKSILVFLVLLSLKLNAHELNFKRITPNEGLSQYDVSCILQDSYGFIWMGTFDGLNRYDGLKIEGFFFQVENENSLSSNRIRSLYEDSQKRIWIGTDGDGLCYYDLHTNKFIRLKNVKTYGRIFDIIENNIGILYAATNNGIIKVIENEKGVFYIDTLNVIQKGITVYNMIAKEHNGIYTSSVNGIWEIENNKAELINAIPAEYYRTFEVDHKGRLWAAGVKGLTVIQKKDGKYFSEKIESFSEMDISAIEESDDGDIWIGTITKGLFRLDLKTKKILAHFTAKSENTSGIINNYIPDIIYGKNNVLWVGCRGGVCYTDLNQKKIKTLCSTEKQQIASIIAVGENIYYSSNPEGMYCYSKRNKKVRKIFDSEITCLTKINDEIYFASKDSFGKLNAIDFTFSKTASELSTIFSISKDRHGNFYLGRIEGLMLLNDTISEFIENIYKVAQPLKGKWVYASYYDKKTNCLWLGTDASGMFKLYFSFEGKLTYMEEFNLSNKGKYHIPNNFIWCFYKDSNNTMWIGSDAGLLYQDENSEKIERVTAEGVANKKILSVIGDKYGTLWMGNSQGLISYNPKKNSIKYYKSEDGLASSSVTEAMAVSEDGTFYVGTTKGINYFSPEDFTANKKKYNTYFTHLKIFGKTINVGDSINGRVLLTKDLKETAELTLTHKEKHFELQFAVFEYMNPTSLQFAYQLYPLYKRWLSADALKRQITFNGLPAGEYTLKIKAANSEGLWNDIPTELKIVILPPWWQTWWFIAFIILFITGCALAVYQIRMHQMKVLRKAKENAEESDRLKTEFLQNMSHEIRTPLNGLLGFSEFLISDNLGKENRRNFINIIQDSGNQLLRIIDDILEISNLETKQVKVNEKVTCLNDLLFNQFSTFDIKAKEKQIPLYFRKDLSDAESTIITDDLILNKIISKLLENALKYTHTGQIELGYRRIGNSIEIYVKDTGIGIHPNMFETIFKRFSQEEKELSGKVGGLGLGLSIAKGNAALLGGELTLKSEKGKGSTFFLTIPYHTITKVI